MKIGGHARPHRVPDGGDCGPAGPVRSHTGADSAALTRADLREHRGFRKKKRAIHLPTGTVSPEAPEPPFPPLATGAKAPPKSL
ncbi:MAG: hypothetical protein ACLFWL_17150 [Candidatus Brocadiia bacterium]|nr:hypothetical protein [Planctomycetota bacterium]